MPISCGVIDKSVHGTVKTCNELNLIGALGEQMQKNFKFFYQVKASLANGNYRETLLYLSDEEFEINHDFIQRAFPTNEKTKLNFTSPTLNLESAVSPAKDPEFVTFLENMTVCFWNLSSLMKIK